MAKQNFPPLASQQTDDVHNVGLLLFGNYNLPFQVIGVLILVATIGVIVNNSVLHNTFSPCPLPTHQFD